MRLKLSERGSLVTIPGTRGTYQTDGTRLYRLGREVQPINQVWSVMTNGGLKRLTPKDLHQLTNTPDIGVPTGTHRTALDTVEGEKGTQTPPSIPQSILEPPGGLPEPNTGTPVSELRLGGRITSALTFLGIQTVEQIPDTEADIEALRGIGPKWAPIISEAVRRHRATDHVDGEAVESGLQESGEVSRPLGPVPAAELEGEADRGGQVPQGEGEVGNTDP